MAAIKLSLQFGRIRNRIPWAPVAAATRPDSVSSEHTTTRASVSRRAWPSGWIGPARTTRGRSEAVIRVSLEWTVLILRASLCAGDGDEPVGVGRQRRAADDAAPRLPEPAVVLEHGGHYKVAPGTAATAERQRRRLRARLRLGIGCAIVSAHDSAAVCTLVTGALSGVDGAMARRPPPIET